MSIYGQPVGEGRVRDSSCRGPFPGILTALHYEGWKRTHASKLLEGRGARSDENRARSKNYQLEKDIFQVL